MLEKPISSLSGGWRMRVSLACALFLEPDLLLLDEPTNHLDLRAILWLQGFLRNYEETFIVVSHERMFLNAVCTEIMHFHRCGLKYYPGDYEAFQQAREDIVKKKGKLQELLDKKRESYLKSIKNIEKAAAKNKRNEKMSGIAASRKKKYERVGLEKTEDGKKWNCQKHGFRPGSINANAGGWKGRKRTAASVAEAPDPAIVFHLLAPPPLLIDSRVPLMQLKKVCFSYGPKAPTVIDSVDFSLYPGDRVSLLGPNGCGKSTLMNLLGGKTKPTKGEISFAPSVVLGFFCQHTTENLDPSLTPLKYLEEVYPNAKTSEIRSYLGRYGLGSELALRRIGDLSGGQKTRVELARVSFCAPHVLLLDEPTNHLDLDTIDALIESLSEFKGAVVFVSHNQHMLLSLESVMYEIKKGKVSTFDGSLEDRIALAGPKK
jgi:ATPase subunit of ABC transporter with duplicated ATPase domains